MYNWLLKNQMPYDKHLPGRQTPEMQSILGGQMLCLSLTNMRKIDDKLSVSMCLSLLPSPIVFLLCVFYSSVRHLKGQMLLGCMCMTRWERAKGVENLQ